MWASRNYTEECEPEGKSCVQGGNAMTIFDGVNDYYLDHYLRGKGGELLRREALEELARRAEERARRPRRKLCARCGRLFEAGGLLCDFCQESEWWHGL